ncbi:MAG: anti-phage ZorAB system protein ZorA [Bacillota bacterium]
MKKSIWRIILAVLFIGITWFFVSYLKFPADIVVQSIFGIVVGITVIAGGDLYRKLRKKQKQVKNATDFLKQFAADKEDGAIKQSDFLKIDKYFSDKGELKDTWNQYEDTIRRIKDNTVGEQKKNYFATIEADYFFDEEFITNNINIKLFNYIPQLLIALGIFGTFLGLVLGLEGLEIENASQTQNSIKSLISGVNLSFLTSLYGIAYSILFTFFQKLFIGNLVTEVNALANQFDLIFPKNTQEDGVKELYNELEKQTSSMESMATDFAEVVDKKISATLEENLGPTLEKLGESAERLADISENTNQNAIEQLVENTGEIISEATQDEISKLTDSLSGVTAKNEALFNNFAQSISKVEDLIDNQQQVIEQTNDSAANVQQTNENVENIVGELEQSLEKINSFSNTQQETIDSFTQIMSDMKDYMEQQSKSNQLIANTLEDNYEITKQQQELNEDLNNTTNNLREVTNNLDPILNNLKDNMNEFDQLSENINKRLVSSISDLEKHYDKINDALGVTLDGLELTVDKLDNNVLENLDDINQNYNHISEQLNEFSQQSTELINSLQEFSSTQQAAHDLWKSYKDSFDNLNQELEEGVVEYTSNVRSGVNNILGEYDSHIENVLENFNATINQFTDTVEELNDLLYDLERIDKESGK